MRLLQTQDVARRLGVARSTIRRWAAEGLIAYRWAGSYRVFEPGDVRRLAAKLNQRAVVGSGTRGGSEVRLAGPRGPSTSGARTGTRHVSQAEDV